MVKLAGAGNRASAKLLKRQLLKYDSRNTKGSCPLLRAPRFLANMQEICAGGDRIGVLPH